MTLAAVAERADVAVQTIYNRVGGRDAVLMAVAERALQDSSFLDRLDPLLAQPFQLGFSQAITVSLVLCGCVLVLAQLGVVLLPDREVRRHAGGSEH